MRGIKVSDMVTERVTSPRAVHSEILCVESQGICVMKIEEGAEISKTE